MGRTLAALMLTLTALAGCSDGADPVTDEEDPYADLEATEDTGIIRGVVVDGSITPIAGALVQIKDSPLNATSNADGAFGFGNLDPGIYTLTVSKAKYVTVTTQANVVAGEDRPPMVTVKLDADPESLPTAVPLYVQGYIACSFRLVVVGFAACGLNGVAELTDNHFLDEVRYDRVTDFVQSELVWRSTQSLGDSMQVSWTDASSGAQDRINASDGPSPVVVNFDREVFEAMNLTNKDLWLRVFTTEREGTDLVDDENYQGPYRNTVYPTYNGTAPAVVKDAVADAVTQCIPAVGCTLDPIKEDCLSWAVLFNACMGVGGVGATIEQPYEIFTTSFYGYRPPAGWMFIEDEIPDPPE